MRRKPFKIFVFCLICSVVLFSQSIRHHYFEKNWQIKKENFTCIKLFEIASKLSGMDIMAQRNAIIKIDNNKIYYEESLLKLQNIKVPIIVEIIPLNRVNHLGIKLFDQEKPYFNQPIFHAAERLSLEFVLSEFHRNPIDQLMNNYGLEISYNNALFGSLSFKNFTDALAVMLYNENFIVTNRDYHYTLKWVKSGQEVEWIIPAQEEIITGYDKRELDDGFIEKLLNIVSDNCQEEHVKLNNLDNENLILKSNGIYLQRGKEFIQDISQDRYFLKDNNSYRLIFNQEYVSESIQNFLLDTNSQTSDAVINLTVKKHNPVRPYVNYHSLLNFLMKDHIVYSGIESSNGDTVQAVTIFENKTYNYIHMLVLDIPKSFISENDKRQLHGKFYINIRRDNVSNIFSQDSENKIKQFQIRID